jgi:Ca2+-binding EF-hand superfamily protein
VCCLLVVSRVLALIRGKAGEPPRPLILTLDQFIRGLDLALYDSVRTSESSGTSDSHMTPGSGVVDDEASGANHDLNTHQDCQPEAGFSGGDNALGCSSLMMGEGDEENDSIDQRLEAVARAVQALRSAVHTAARDYLATTDTIGKTPSYREFRAALSHVFASFDSDGNGRLDIRELSDCLKLIGVRVTEKNLTLVRECFCSSQNDAGANDSEDDTVTIAEFISFVLSDAARSSPTEELGLLGFRVRTAVLNRLQRAQAHLDSKGDPASTEDALRWVFRSAYPGKRSACPLREFARLLRTIKGLESLAPAQIARVAARLDRDGDQSISFDELLAWLRLLPDTPASMDASPTAEAPPLQFPEPLNHRSGFRSVLRDAAMKVQRLREWLTQVASALKGDGGVKTYTKVAQASALFDHVDTNASGKITRDELETFVRTLPPELTQPTGENGAVVLAEQLVDVMDCSGNGVVTRDEWLRFAMDSHAPIAEEFAVRVALRREVESLFPTADRDAMVSQWLECIPGAIPTAAPTSREGVTAVIHGVHHFKIRVGEFKAGVRKVIEASGGGKDAASSSPVVPFVASAVDAAIKKLDSDSSGWITTAKLLRWLFPTRDLEELLRLLRLSWRHQWLSGHASPQLTPAQCAEKLYSLFDADGNGCLARKELKTGFRTILGLEFAEREVEELVTAFDGDGDRVWNRQEFLDFAQLVVQSGAADTMNGVDQVNQSTTALEGNEAAGSGSERYGDDDDEPLLLSSSSSSSEHSTPPLAAASASAAYSDASFQALSGAGTSPARSREASPLHPSVYDDDFDE